MGKVEKVIVLSVLFVIALILVVSLTLDDPLQKSRAMDAGAPAGKPSLADITGAAAPGKPAPSSPDGTKVASVGGEAASGVAKTDGLLSAVMKAVAPSTQVAATPSSATIRDLPPGSILKTTEGLEDSILADMKLYTWKEGDLYRSIANKYYGDWSKFYVLRRSNEGRNDVKPGERIFVPIFDSDLSAGAPKTQAAPGDEPKLVKHGKAGKSPSKSSTPAEDNPAGEIAKGPSGKKLHVVKEGETLWKIAKEELGNGSRWPEIYKLNHPDKLASEKALLKKGTELRIP